MYAPNLTPHCAGNRSVRAIFVCQRQSEKKIWISYIIVVVYTYILIYSYRHIPGPGLEVEGMFMMK